MPTLQINRFENNMYMLYPSIKNWLKCPFKLNEPALHLPVACNLGKDLVNNNPDKEMEGTYMEVGEVALDVCGR